MKQFHETLVLCVFIREGVDLKRRLIRCSFVAQQSKYERVLSIEEGMESHGAASAPSSSAGDTAARDTSQTAPQVQAGMSSRDPPLPTSSRGGNSAFATGSAQPSSAQSSYDEEVCVTVAAAKRGPVARLKGISPSSSQQLELDDALASTADLDGPCADKQAGCLQRACASCLHCCGELSMPTCPRTLSSTGMEV